MVSCTITGSTSVLGVHGKVLSQPLCFPLVVPDAFSALQAASIVFGLPFTLLVMYMCQASSCMCNFQLEALTVFRMKFKVIMSFQGIFMSIFGGVFNVLKYAVSFGTVLRLVSKRNGLASAFRRLSSLWLYFSPLSLFENALNCRARRSRAKKLVLFITGVYTLIYVTMITFFVLALKSFVFVALVGLASSSTDAS
jgi:hypothetical protein